MAYDPRELPPAVLDFLTVRHLATLTTLRADGTSHVVPVGFTWDDETGLARVITSGPSVKARNAGRPGARAAVCQVDGRTWLTLEGPVEVAAVPVEVQDAERRYARRYRTPRENPRRVVLVIRVDRVLGSVPEEAAITSPSRPAVSAGAGPGSADGEGGRDVSAAATSSSPAPAADGIG